MTTRDDTDSLWRSLLQFTYPAERMAYTAAYAVLAFLGASVAPLVGGFVDSRAGWRWNLITTAILVTVSWILIIVGCPESFVPVLLARKNKHLARRDGPNLATRYKNALVTPFKLLFTEPVLAIVSFYLAFLYAVFYALFPVRLRCSSCASETNGLRDRSHSRPHRRSSPSSLSRFADGRKRAWH